MTKQEKIAELKKFAHSNYESGGHWAYETFHEDVERKPLDLGYIDFVLDDSDTEKELEASKQELRKWWGDYNGVVAETQDY